jgi:AraC-like DNA-binding protein
MLSYSEAAMSLAPINLIRQVELRAPLDLLAEQGAPAGALLFRAGLPAWLQEPGDGFLPARHLLGFYATCARYLHRDDFSFRAVQRAPAAHVGSWGPRLGRCWRLRDALHLFAVQVVQDAPFLDAGVSYGAEHAWLWRRRHLTPKEPFAEQLGAFYTLASMLRIVRMVAGADWRPPAFQSEAPAPDWLMSDEGIGEGQMVCGGRQMAIAVPYELLDLRIAGPRARAGGPDEARPEDAARDFTGSLQQALAPFARGLPPSLELGAEIAETSPRTLRRRLEEAGTSWRQLLDRVRFEACEELIREPDLSLNEIAAELGYADQAHFTRAFRRWTGEMPSAYRRRRLVR